MQEIFIWKLTNKTFLILLTHFCVIRISSTSEMFYFMDLKVWLKPRMQLSWVCFNLKLKIMNLLTEHNSFADLFRVSADKSVTNIFFEIFDFSNTDFCFKSAQLSTDLRAESAKDLLQTKVKPNSRQEIWTADRTNGQTMKFLPWNGMDHIEQ